MSLFIEVSPNGLTSPNVRKSPFWGTPFGNQLSGLLHNSVSPCQVRVAAPTGIASTRRTLVSIATGMMGAVFGAVLITVIADCQGLLCQRSKAFSAAQS